MFFVIPAQAEISLFNRKPREIPACAAMTVIIGRSDQTYY